LGVIIGADIFIGKVSALLSVSTMKKTMLMIIIIRDDDDSSIVSKRTSTNLFGDLVQYVNNIRECTIYQTRVMDEVVLLAKVILKQI
jgi:hypothetical protein